MCLEFRKDFIISVSKIQKKKKKRGRVALISVWWVIALAGVQSSVHHKIQLLYLFLYDLVWLEWYHYGPNIFRSLEYTGAAEFGNKPFQFSPTTDQIKLDPGHVHQRLFSRLLLPKFVSGPQFLFSKARNIWYQVREKREPTSYAQSIKDCMSFKVNCHLQEEL